MAAIIFVSDFEDLGIFLRLRMRREEDGAREERGVRKERLRDD